MSEETNKNLSEAYKKVLGIVGGFASEFQEPPFAEVGLPEPEVKRPSGHRVYVDHVTADEWAVRLPDGSLRGFIGGGFFTEPQDAVEEFHAVAREAKRVGVTDFEAAIVHRVRTVSVSEWAKAVGGDSA